MTPPAARIGAGHRRGVSSGAETRRVRGAGRWPHRAPVPVQNDRAAAPGPPMSRDRLRLTRGDRGVAAVAHHRPASRSAARYFDRRVSAFVQFVPDRQAWHFWVCTMYARYVACTRGVMGGVVMVGSMSKRLVTTW